MKLFLTQLYKDFKGYFSYLNAYVIFGGYAILSAIACLYLGNYFARESNAIGAYFALQPLILMIIIPAITMRTWCEENKSGTIELLLTQPIGYGTLVMAKFGAAFCFFSLLVLSSLPLLFLTYWLFNLDNGVVVANYIGVWLLGAFFTALGCLISAFHRNHILCYLTTTLCIFVVMQMSFLPINIGRTPFSLQALTFDYNYNGFLNGAIQTSHMVYFSLGTMLCWWLNTVVIAYARQASSQQKKWILLFGGLLGGIYIASILGCGYGWNKTFDITSAKKFTLSAQTAAFLHDFDKRINVTIYEAKNKREDVNSSYAVYADYVERLFKLFEKESHGAIRPEIILVEPFSEQEQTLLQNNVVFTEDKLGYKVFMSADFTDNEGNVMTINAFNPMRQEFLETDILRTIRHFGLPKKNIALIAAKNTQQELSALKNTLSEFYQVTLAEPNVRFIAPTFAAVLVINPMELSFEFLLAMEQYVLNGGNLIILYEPENNRKQNNTILQNFLQKFGIKPDINTIASYQHDDEKETIGPALVMPDFKWDNIRSVWVNGAGIVNLSNGDDYTTSPLITLDNQAVAAISVGRYVSDYLELAAESDEILAVSKKVGKVVFFYDCDLIKDYMLATDDSSGNNGFYQIVPFNDNLLFWLRVVDWAAADNIEPELPYRPFALANVSIGRSLLDGIKEKFTAEIDDVKQKMADYKQNQVKLGNNVLNFGVEAASNWQEAQKQQQTLTTIENKLGKINATIFNHYQIIVTSISICIIFVFPAIMLILMMLIWYLCHRYKLRVIRRLVKP
ncbi:MAG: Gldg family protein [Alphaproteobacteria bacterium]|nr:Gldg family protein [Alphaproteobacteria bacterium]